LSALRIFAMAVALSAVAAPTAAAADGAKSGPAETMVERINAVRADHGLPALRAAPKLMRTSRSYARRLMAADGFSHGASFRHTGFRETGEMLAYNNGWRLEPGPSIRMWLSSPVHRALMLSRSFRYIGAGPARGRYSGSLKTIWVIHLGAR
jgi:uncharacterized protein YkwD